MGIVNLPYSIRNATVSAAAQLNDNFDALVDEINGALDEDNIASDAQLTGATVTVTTKVVTPTVDADGCLVIKLGSTDGSHSVKFRDYRGDTRLEVRSDGKVFVT